MYMSVDLVKKELSLGTHQNMLRAVLEQSMLLRAKSLGGTSTAALGYLTPIHRNDWYNGKCEQLKNKKNAP